MADLQPQGGERVASVDHQAPAVEHSSIRPKGAEASFEAGSASSSARRHGAVELVGADSQPPIQTTVAELDRSKGRFGYLKKRQFWIVLLLSQALAVTITGTNTLSSLLRDEGTSIPAFQSLFNYILLNLIYTTWTIYKYGFKGWLRLCWKDGWRYFILAFFDVEGNYFTVLAYQYTTILSAQLINFWAIAIVVAVSLIFLKVRYHLFQYVGILVCCGGLGVLVASDHITKANPGGASNAVKGDLFALLGATCYGLSNVTQEFLVSKKPLYEVIGQLAWWAMFIIGVQAAIFDRAAFQSATWNSKVGGYMTGYTLLLTWFYSAVPVVLRMASAAFLNIGLLTGNFWGVVVGTQVFGLSIHWMYPIAFVLIMVGHFIYYGTEGVLGEAKKPWLGENQEGGSDGFGTARRQLEHPGVTL
ncbi:related to membrane protein [Ramularia collo-cygni]|uniref:Related to membrane protein n=1 Tax=Ramularia collo-cygni TaxID=112498 RepID=A0A2D3V3R3_9PEZI|nr:related to membrane protein [Ramularia collo-cygni]CZT14923.1 related to membrane protein [Ramularia collo-cygni]